MHDQDHMGNVANVRVLMPRPERGELITDIISRYQKIGLCTP